MIQRKILPIMAVLVLLAGFSILHPQAEENSVLTEVLGQLYEKPAAVEILENDGSDTIASLKLSRALNEPMEYTFASELTLSGLGDPGDVVEIVVFTVDEEGSPILWHRNTIRIGASGLLQEKVPLTLTGLQRLLIGVTHEEHTAVRVYEISRKSQEVLEQLLNYDMNLYREFGKP